MANPIEMGSTHESIVDRLKQIKGYRELFAKAFGTEDFTIDHAAKAITTFERTIMSGNAPYDRYKAGQKNAMTAAQFRARELRSLPWFRVLAPQESARKSSAAIPIPACA